MFASAGVPFNTMTDSMKFNDVFDTLVYQFKTTLMNANRAEKIHAGFERATEPMDIPDLFHFVYNSRFGPFIRSKLWQMSSHFSYAKSALTNLGDAINTENALKATMGTQELKAFKERGDYFIFMYSSVFNGDTYELIIKSLGHFIRYFSYKLAENAVVIPDYDHFSDKRPEGGQYIPGKQETYVKKDIVNFGSNPSLEERVLAYESFLTWTCQMALHFAYMQNDSHDIGGVQGASLKIQVSKVAKIRNRYNQVPHLTQNTNGKVTNPQKTPQTRAKRSALSQQVTTKHI